jgi:hypothetical protein
MKAVIDSNILIDYLSGSIEAKTEIERYDRPHISIISWMEVLVGARSEVEETKIRGFFSRFEILDVSRQVAEEAIALRREHAVKLPDAIIWATARAIGAMLVTRDRKGFPRSAPDVRCPY